MVKHLKAKDDDPERWHDDANGHDYGRIVGGLAWPAQEQAGFLVVLARDLEPDASGNHHYWRLAEYESADLGELIRKAMDMRQEYHARDWVGNVGNKPALYLLGELMQRYPYKDRLSLDMAPHAGDSQGLAFYLGLIKEVVRPGKKRLHLGDSTLPGYLAQPQASDLHKTPEDYPAVAALGYALAELFGWQGAIPTNTVSYTDRPGAWML